jgi:hypothetical protein
VREKLIIFAGAGVSTEGLDVFTETLYQHIAADLQIPDATGASFPDLMSRFCTQPDGRAKLLQIIRRRLEYMKEFPQVYHAASAFHRAIAPIPFVNDIVTTNWDDLFEKECGATPFVYPEDFRFADLPGRKVFKLHGSMTNYGSLVLTKDDYANCSEQLTQSLIGSALRMLLATKTILFAGYSLRDPDFLQVYEFVRSQLGVLAPQSYVLTLDTGSVDRFRAFGLQPIITDASYFFELVNEHLVREKYLLPDWTSLVKALLKLVKQEHSKLHAAMNYSRHPDILYSAFFQDGLIHAFERMLARRSYGDYATPQAMVSKVPAYADMRSEKLARRQYGDVAYIDGYLTGTTFLVPGTDGFRRRLPLYYVFGADAPIYSLSSFQKVRRKAAILHKSAYRFAQHAVRAPGGDPKNLVFQHMAFL